jgi:predicted AlkP superfamily phosphohydrolase/phosphomutase
MTDESGNPLGTKVYRPEDVYSECRNIPPDLIVYFGNLRWRSVGSVGHGSVWTRENDIGPDDANHAQNGVIVFNGPGFSGGKSENTFQICEVANTLLRILGVSPPSDRES